MAWKATGQPTVRKQRDKRVVRVDGIATPSVLLWLPVPVNTNPRTP